MYFIFIIDQLLFDMKIYQDIYKIVVYIDT